MAQTLSHYGISDAEFWEYAEKKPSVMGVIHGACGEMLLDKILAKVSESPLHTPDDHNREESGDRHLTYGKRVITVDSKSLQKGKSRQFSDGTWVGVVQIDGSDRTTKSTPNGSTVTTTCIPYNLYDVVAVNCCRFGDSPKFAYARLSDLPRSDTHVELVKSSHTVHWPPKAPFTDDLESVLRAVCSSPASPVPVFEPDIFEQFA